MVTIKSMALRNSLIYLFFSRFKIEFPAACWRKAKISPAGIELWRRFRLPELRGQQMLPAGGGQPYLKFKRHSRYR
ncbi:MAG TPA: hypothetical protein DCY53_01780 [Desulfobacteraceae bacterium]|nr:hypothetical protein [Desulfobacteraceae bacterium]